LSEAQTGWKPGKTSWCWQPKAALHHIREALDAESAVSSGLLVYVILTEIASDKRSHTFQTTHSFIAMRSGLSQRTVQRRIKALTEIGVLKCDVPSLRAPATYTLLLIEPKDEQQPLHNATPQLRSVVPPSKNAPWRTSEECIQEVPKNGHKTCSTKEPRKFSPIQKELADMVEGILGNGWENDAGKWLNRITGGVGDAGNTVSPEPGKVRRVFEEVADAQKNNRITTTPAQYAEQMWKEFK
jgi:DNA-binding Lrp family transcriptional regulator